ncbi:MAG: hypothetical protein AAF990_27380 [Bacteroidota bacterium]
MKLRIAFFALLCSLVIWSCQKEEAVPAQATASSDTEQAATFRNDCVAVISVYWDNNPKDPVLGAVVFDMETNEPIGRTDQRGNVSITSNKPAWYRVVDPTYGRQQARVYFPDDFEFGSDGKGRKVIGWTIDGKPIYE